MDSDTTIELPIVRIKATDYTVHGSWMFSDDLRRLADAILWADIGGAFFIEVDWSGIRAMMSSQYAVFSQVIRHDIENWDCRISFENVTSGLQYMMQQVVYLLNQWSE